jgi:heptosyltransferase III
MLDKILNYSQTVKYHRSIAYWKPICLWIQVFFLQKIAKKNVRIIILTEHIGDVISFTPYAEHLHKTHPNSYIIWLIAPKYALILQNNPYIQKVLPVPCDGYTHKVKQLLKDYVLDVRFNNNNHCHLCYSLPVAQKIDKNFNLNNYYNYGVLLEIFSTFAGNKLPASQHFPKLYLKENIELLQKLPEKYLCLHLESNEEIREWPLQLWESILPKMYEKYKLAIVIVGLSKKVQPKHNFCIDLSGELNLEESMLVVKNCAYFVGIDSSMAHVANCYERPSLILLGKFRNMERYMPYSGYFYNSKKVSVPFNTNKLLKDLTIAEVLEALPQTI